MCQNNRCSSCIYGCKNEVPESKNCVNYEQGLSLEELNDEIRNQNVNLKRLCKSHYLQYGKMKDMLSGKMDMHFKYRYFLMKRLEEKTIYIDYLSEVVNG